MKMKDMTLVAMFTALIAVLSQFSFPIPVSPVPVTLQTFAVFFTGTVLGSRKGTLAILVYIFIGLLGVPVFSQGKSGLPALAGPTGGYILGFVLAAYIIGKIVERGEQVTYLRVFGAMMAGLAVVYTVGTIQLKFVLGVTYKEAFIMGTLFYLLLDLIKMLIGAYLGCAVRNALLKAFPDSK